MMSCVVQVGAASRALSGPGKDDGCGEALQCASLKSNVGHLEAAAAAAGLASLVAAPLSAAVVVVNAQLRGFFLASRLVLARDSRL